MSLIHQKHSPDYCTLLSFSFISPKLLSSECGHQEVADFTKHYLLHYAITFAHVDEFFFKSVIISHNTA